MKTLITIIKSRRKVLMQSIFGIFLIISAIYFAKHEQAEVMKIEAAITDANPIFLTLGIFLSLLFVLIQGLMYKLSFSAIGYQVSFLTNTLLYLKRFVISIFLPVGGLANLLFFNKDVEKEGVKTPQIIQASSIFFACSMVTGLVFMIPFIIYAAVFYGLEKNIGLGLFAIVLVVIVLTVLISNIRKKGRIYKYVLDKFPKVVLLYEEIKQGDIDKQKVFVVIGLSLIIECISVLMVILAFYALGHSVSLINAAIIYAIVLMVMLVSPFLKGAGAIEFAMAYALKMLGYDVIDAITIAILFRLFEFWSILILGSLSFILRRDEMIYRLLPPVILLVIGVVNILSALTVSINDRFLVIKELIPLELIHGSNYLSIVTGLIALLTSVYLIRGMKSAWLTAVILSLVSLAAHMFKGLDYEEAILSLLLLIPLIIWRDKYQRKIRPIPLNKIWPVILSLFIIVIILGSAGFYILNQKHFGSDFNLLDSVLNTFKGLLLIDTGLIPHTNFGREFLIGINILGASSILAAFYLLLRPYIYVPERLSQENRAKGDALVKKYGQSVLDYYKTYFDKEVFFSSTQEAMIAYKVEGNYAVVLENPVANDDVSRNDIVTEFENYCRTKYLIPIYYRIPEEDLQFYLDLGKKSVKLGEDAVIDLMSFSLQGGGRKELRNTINKLTKSGFILKVRNPPLTAAFVQQLQSVSDDWLTRNNRKEIIFSQGLFDDMEITNHTIFSIENENGKVFAFINQVPGVGFKIANFDLMRKTDDAPNGSMDFLFAQMFTTLKEQGYESATLGMVPLSGMDDDTSNTLEKTLHFAYENIAIFSHYKSLRFFKEKFDPNWTMMYLIFNSDYDLLMFPRVFGEIIKND